MGIDVVLKPVACVILPTYNEAENIERIVRLIFAKGQDVRSHDLHVLVVDDHSPDGTQNIVRDLTKVFPNLHLITGEKKGLGDAYKRGMKYAVDQLNPDLVFEMDADGQHDPGLIPLFVLLANHGFSLVIGSRFVPGGATPGFSMYRKAISLTGNWMIRYLGGIPGIRDCTSGLRCIKASLIPKCDFRSLSSQGYSFQSSLLLELLRKGARVIEVPITFPNREYGQSKLSRKDQVDFLINVFKIRFRRNEEFVKFCVVGLSGVVVNLCIYWVLTRLLGMDMRVAYPIAIELAILSNFVFNEIWTFRSRDSRHSFIGRVIRFHGVAGAAGLANYGVFLFFSVAVGLYDIAASGLGILIGSVLNYCLNSAWTWREMRHHRLP